jgi:hypothetical protein
MERTGFSGLYRLALVAVLANLALVAVLALSLAGDAQVFLPIVALTLPLLTAAALEARAKRVRSDDAQITESRPNDAPVFASLKQAA